MYRSGELRREFGLRGGPYAGGKWIAAASELPAHARRRLSAAISGVSAEGPILAEAPPRASRVLAAMTTASGALALYVLWGWGYAILGDSWAIQPWSAVWAYAALLWVMVASVHKLIRSFRTEGWVPLPPGRYLLPYDLVTIEDGVVTILPLGDARQVRVDETRGSVCVRVLYGDGSVGTVTGPKLAGPSIWARLLAAQHEIEEASLGGAPVASDPLAGLRDASGWALPISAPASRTPARATRERSVRVAPLALAVACALAAPAILWARNRASDEAMFAYLSSANAYRMYLRSGATRHAGAVRETLLPRAALDEAEHRGDFRSLRAYLADFPKSKFEAEARAHFHDACVTELSRQSFENVRGFDQRNADCDVKAAVGERLRAGNEERFQRASKRGLSSLRGYVRTTDADSTFRDRALAKLAELYENERVKVESNVERAQLRDVLLGIEGRAQRDEIPGELYVPVTMDAGEQVTRGVLAGFDAALHDVIDGALVAIYHPTNVAPDDLARAHTLRIVIMAPDEGGDGEVFVRYELASGERTVARWSRTLQQNVVPERFGAELARGAMTL